MSLVIRSIPHRRAMLLTLNRPAKRNALSRALLESLAEHLAEAERDDGIRCVVITGDAQAFSAGSDITEMASQGVAALVDERRVRSWDTVESFSKPLIAAVNGICYGGGNELAMLADIIIAGETARFGQPEVNLASPPGDGGTQRLTRAVGKSLAMLMMLTGEPIDARTARDYGLVAEITPADRTVERAIEIAAAIAEKPPSALRMIKAAVRAAFELPLQGGLAVERKLVYRALQSPERVEGLAAYAEKRKPRFA